MTQPRAASLPDISPPTLVERREQLAELEQAVAQASRFALDTESNSLYAYAERVCLIQLSTDQADFIVDPFQFSGADFEFLRLACADPAVEKTFHAAEYDVMVLRRDLGFQFANIFDTMIAARVLGWENFGLAALLLDHFGVRMNKAHQRANWGLRPLSPALLSYAQQDVHCLLPLRDKLNEALAAQDGVEEARELFDEVSQARWRGGGFDPDGFWRLNGARDLPPAGLGVLKELYHYREQQARQRDLPVFKIMSDACLVKIAEARPTNRADLARLRALSEGQLRRLGADTLACVQRGLKAKPPHPSHRHNGMDDLVLRRFEALHLWRKETAAQRGVSSDVILSKDALWELAAAAPRALGDLERLASIGPWRRKTYGGEILAVLARLDQEGPAAS